MVIDEFAGWLLPHEGLPLVCNAADLLPSKN
jgi:hypothetical protein